MDSKDYSSPSNYNSLLNGPVKSSKLYKLHGFDSVQRDIQRQMQLFEIINEWEEKSFNSANLSPKNPLYQRLFYYITTYIPREIKNIDNPSENDVIDKLNDILIKLGVANKACDSFVVPGFIKLVKNICTHFGLQIYFTKAGIRLLKYTIQTKRSVGQTGSSF